MNDNTVKSGGHCAVITGASSGLGTEFARLLGEMGYYLVLTGRNEEALSELKSEIGEDKCTVIAADLSDTKSCIDLYAKSKRYSPDMLINNAGFGLYGTFAQTSLSKELEMIDVNIKANHILFKLFLREFMEKDRGYILNVASLAGMAPGPLMSTYYSTKSYVIRQTLAVYEELKREGRGVHVSVLCPGPVNTRFNSRAGIAGFGRIRSISPEYCAAYALKKMRENKPVIIPTLPIKIAAAAAKAAPVCLVSAAVYAVQRGKMTNTGKTTYVKTERPNV